MVSGSPAAAAAPRHPVESGGDVGAHRPALAIGQRPRVATAGAGRRRVAESGRRGLGGRRRPDPGAGAGRGPGDLHSRPRHDPDRERCERSRSGKLTATAPRGTPLRSIACRAAAVARRRYASRSRWRGLTRPPMRAGSNSRGRSALSERPADSAARSTARWARPFAVAPPPIATNATISRATAKISPPAAGSAWPASELGPVSSAAESPARLAPRPRSPPSSIMRRARRAVSPPGSRPARARLA